MCKSLTSAQPPIKTGHWRVYNPKNGWKLTRFVVAIFLLTNISCTDSNGVIIRRKFMMDTLVEIIVTDHNKDRAKRAIREAFSEMERIEAFTDPLKGSEITKINNHASDGPVVVSREFFEIIAKAIKFSRLTHGAFDITVAPVSRLWGFLGDETDFSIPESGALSKALSLVNYRDIVLDGKKTTVWFKRRGMKISLGGIAKGYAVGRAIAVLQREGIRNAIVNAGGDIEVIGDKYGNPWGIGVKHPREPGEIITAFKFKGEKCVFTSGDYEKYFMVNNKRYHHIIDPSTGFPADSSCISVTIVCDDPVDADALATGTFVLGPKKGLDLINSLPGVEAIMVCKTKNGLTIKQTKNINSSRGSGTGEPANLGADI